MPRVSLKRRASDERRRAPDRVGQAIDDAIDELALGLISGAPTRGVLTGLFRIRVEDWRILYEHRPDGTLRVLRIAHRSEAYRSDPR
jgi:mRNA-degrading endonuclease RelE of RelBE toxin-antitoxin system